MPKYFCAHTHLSESEREMMKVPYRNYPKPRSPSNFGYTCSSCQYRKPASSGLCVAKNSGDKCPYLLERLQSGTANRLVCLQQARFDTVTLPRSIYFNTPQKRRFRLLCGSIEYDRKNPREMAVLYLLSSEEFLFLRCIGNTPEELLRNLDTRGLSMDAYTVLCIAKDILLHTSYTIAEDYADEEIISHRVVGLVFCTLLILRYGLVKSSPLRRFI